jgi:hypothetical protein
MRGFPDDPSVGLPAPTPHFKRGPKRKSRRRVVEREIPEDERTHVAVSRFKLACGLKRIGVEAALIVGEAPTCEACKADLLARAARARAVKELIDETGETQW